MSLHLKDLKSRPLILASSSPRRKELLATCGFDFEIVSPDVDESIHDGEQPELLVRRLADLKTDAVASLHHERLILGADTVVVIDNQILGKPIDRADAASMLNKLQGRTHLVVGGISLRCKALDLSLSEVSVTEVTLCRLTASQIDRYLDTGEPFDKAGSYAAQGIGMQFVESLKGSYTNVVGLDMAVVYGLMLSLEAQISIKP